MSFVLFFEREWRGFKYHYSNFNRPFKPPPLPTQPLALSINKLKRKDSQIFKINKYISKMYVLIFIKEGKDFSFTFI
jgi:hypothetical protein